MIRNAEVRVSSTHTGPQSGCTSADLDLLGPLVTCVARLSPASGKDGALVGVVSAMPGVGVTTIARGLYRCAELTGRGSFLVPRSLLDSGHWTAVRAGGDGLTLPSPPEADAESDRFGAAMDPIRTQRGAGQRPPECTGDQLGGWLSDLRTAYEIVFFDLPPVGVGCQSLLRQLDGVILVVAAQTVQRVLVRQAVDVLQANDVSLLGTILNQQPRLIPSWVYRLI
jgi:Mrp family chromosome partitioning ATPase